VWGCVKHFGGSGPEIGGRGNGWSKGSRAGG
jgi:hypothetical protein